MRVRYFIDLPDHALSRISADVHAPVGDLVRLDTLPRNVGAALERNDDLGAPILRRHYAQRLVNYSPERRCAGVSPRVRTAMIRERTLAER